MNECHRGPLISRLEGQRGPRCAGVRGTVTLLVLPGRVEVAGDIRIAFARRDGVANRHDQEILHDHDARGRRNQVAIMVARFDADIVGALIREAVRKSATTGVATDDVRTKNWLPFDQPCEGASAAPARREIHAKARWTNLERARSKEVGDSVTVGITAVPRRHCPIE